MKRTSNSLLMSAPDPSFRFIRAAIADKCNLACMYCPKSSGMENIVPDDYRGRPLPIDTYLRNLKVLNKLGMQAISFTGGEPTLNRNLNEYLEFARSTFQRVELTTNALNVRSFISSIRDNVDLVKVSLDSVNFEVVQRVTRTRAKDELSIAKKSIALLLENGVNVGINVVVGRHNVHLLRDLFAYCRELLAISPRLHVSLLDIYFHPEIRDFYAANFIDMAEVIEYLSLADATVTDRRGCSIKWYEYNNVQIRTKDSLESTYRSDLCRSCPSSPWLKSTSQIQTDPMRPYREE